jgi:hypothetical protein
MGELRFDGRSRDRRRRSELSRAACAAAIAIGAASVADVRAYNAPSGCDARNATSNDPCVPPIVVSDPRLRHTPGTGRTSACGEGKEHPVHRSKPHARSANAVYDYPAESFHRLE